MILGPNRMFRGTIVAHAYAAVAKTLPALVQRWARSGVGNAVAGRADRMWAALFGRRNPLFQVIAITIYCVGLAIFFLCVAPHIPNRYAGMWHWLPISVTLVANMGFYAAASAADPGTVTPDNARAACRVFPYDCLLYFRRNCDTCRLPKPARSKHCSTCGKCVQMAEHHCVWLNNCVGLRNTRWFVGFLATFAIVCVYGAYLASTVLLELRHVLGLASAAAAVWDDDLGRHVALSFRSSLLYVLDSRPLLAVLLVLLVVMAPAIVFFAGYQLRIVMLGYTGNEETKWLNVADAIHDGVVFAVRESDDAPREVIRVIEEEDQPADLRPRRPITHLRQVPNLYDRGPWRNLAFALFPPPSAPARKTHTG
ncbi:palmitoyltransferase swf1 [Coemansia biformis]|uniref:Palmitoyltransferase n=1 Tax=Coemansia biformis TaxID=1286918 RepID=A0A9W7YCK4_9FUNG|nr:palmitoyltransferase swf1 [Coemansia biformis]